MGNLRGGAVGWRRRGSPPRSFTEELSHAGASPRPNTPETRQERIDAILQELLPKVEHTVRQPVERAVDVPEAEEFGDIDREFCDAGQQLVNEVRQASLASRKKTRLANLAEERILRAG